MEQTGSPLGAAPESVRAVAQEETGVASENLRSRMINIRLSVDALPEAQRRDLLALVVVANPLLTAQHGAAVWGLLEAEGKEAAQGVDEAHARLEWLAERALLQGVGYDVTRNQADAYSFQPAIAQVLRTLAPEEALAEPRAHYARLAYDDDKGIDASPDVAALIQTLLPDLLAAIPALPDEERASVAWRGRVDISGVRAHGGRGGNAGAGNRSSQDRP